MNDNNPPVLAGNVANASFGFLIVATFLWGAGGIIATLVQGLPFNWTLIAGPLMAVLLFQIVMTWVAATIRAAVSEGLALGFTYKEVQEHLATNRDRLN